MFTCCPPILCKAYRLSQGTLLPSSSCEFKSSVNSNKVPYFISKERSQVFSSNYSFNIMVNISKAIRAYGSAHRDSGGHHHLIYLALLLTLAQWTQSPFCKTLGSVLLVHMAPLVSLTPIQLHGQHSARHGFVLHFVCLFFSFWAGLFTEGSSATYNHAFHLEALDIC